MEFIKIRELIRCFQENCRTKWKILLHITIFKRLRNLYNF